MGVEYIDQLKPAMFAIYLYEGGITLNLQSDIFSYEGTGPLTQSGNEETYSVELTGTINSNFWFEGQILVEDGWKGPGYKSYNKVYNANGSASGIAKLNISASANPFAICGGNMIVEPFQIRGYNLDDCSEFILTTNKQISDSDNMTGCTK